jgi:hypothetical protein
MSLAWTAITDGAGGWSWRRRVAAGVVVFLAALRLAGWAGEPPGSAEADRLAKLERVVARLNEELKSVKAELRESRGLTAEEREVIASLDERVSKLDESRLAIASRLKNFRLGGYGEMHANFGEGASGDQFDIHRLVLYLGYDFNDWIKLHSETEIEHAFVSDGDGDLVIEQLYTDFLLSDGLNVRVGRVLTPLGIVNKKHEPPTFNGVERPAFARSIIPTTWSSDGIGIFGSLTPSLKYEAYVVGGLDGSGFDSVDGIRGGRIKERPSLHDPAVTGRIDYYPFAQRAVGLGQTLRVGLSSYLGGIDNGDQGDDPGVSGDVQIYSADFEYTIDRFDFRGAIAHETIDGARGIGGGVAEGIFGWYLEGAYHFMPDAWKKGRLETSDAVVFLRYDDINTQDDMPSGVARDPAGDRDEWTVGLGWYLTPNFVLKADYQMRDSAAGERDDRVNLGVGWSF